VFILPPAQQTLLQRLTDRRRDTPDEIANRFRNARREIQMAKGAGLFDKMVVNDIVDRAVDEIIEVIRLRRNKGK